MTDPAEQPAPVEWYRSHAFTALVQTSVLSSLAWLGIAIGTNVWDWRTGLAVPLISNATVMLRTMWSPTVIGAFPIMNKNNAGGT